MEAFTEACMEAFVIAWKKASGEHMEAFMEALGNIGTDMHVERWYLIVYIITTTADKQKQRRQNAYRRPFVDLRMES